MSLRAIKSLFLQPTWDHALGTWRMDPRIDLLPAQKPQGFL